MASTDTTKLEVTTREESGSRAMRRLRRSGRVPGILYGGDGEPVAFHVDARILRNTLAHAHAVVDLAVDGAKAQPVMVKDLQRHPVRRDVLHVDFLRVDADVEVTVEVPIVLHGEAHAVTSNDGQVDQALYHLGVNAKPADIPNEISIDISGMKLGDAIRIGDLVLPAGATTDSDPEDAVVMASAALEADLGEDAEAEEGAEGEGGETAEGGDAGGDAPAEGDAE